MNVEIPGTSTKNPQDAVRIRQVVDDDDAAGPSEEIGTKQDPSHTRSDFERDLNRATKRVREEPS